MSIHDYILNNNITDIINYVNTSDKQIILLLPIGPPGSGKTTLKNILKKQIINRTIIAPSRDEIFKKYRENHGLKKTRHLTHIDMINQITNLNIHHNQSYVIYIDSTNSIPEIRHHYINLVKPNVTKFISFHTKHLKNPILYLQNRTQHRYHPTFPKDKEEQLKTINTIINTIEYPNNNNTFNIYI